MAGPSNDVDMARKTWEMENDIETIPSSDEIFRYDAQEQQQFLAARKSSFNLGFQVRHHRHITFDSQGHGTRIHITLRTFKYLLWHC